MALRDRKDARGIAQLMRLGWFRPVHCKSMAAQETRAILAARKLVAPVLATNASVCSMGVTIVAGMSMTGAA
jgi:hypothetical protein